MDHFCIFFCDQYLRHLLLIEFLINNATDVVNQGNQGCAVNQGNQGVWYLTLSQTQKTPSQQSWLQAIYIVALDSSRPQRSSKCRGLARMSDYMFPPLYITGVKNSCLARMSHYMSSTSVNNRSFKNFVL